MCEANYNGLNRQRWRLYGPWTWDAIAGQGHDHGKRSCRVILGHTINPCVEVIQPAIDEGVERFTGRGGGLIL